MSDSDPRRAPVFRTSTAIAAGMTRAELRRSDLQQFFHGVRSRGLDEAHLVYRVRAYASRMVERAAFSHTTAAQLWGLPLPLRFESQRDLHVIVPTGRAPRGRGVIGHHGAIADVVRTRDGVRLVHPAIAWAQCAELVSVPDLVALGNAAITGDPLHSVPAVTTKEDLERATERMRGGRGHVARALALRYIRVGAISRTESLSDLLFVSSGLPHPELNYPVCDGTGRFVAILDAAWPQFRVGYDYEGRDHTTTRRFRRDIARASKVGDLGWSHVKATADDLFDYPHPLVRRLASRLIDRGWAGAVEVSRFTPFER